MVRSVVRETARNLAKVPLVRLPRRCPQIAVRGARIFTIPPVSCCMLFLLLLPLVVALSSADIRRGQNRSAALFDHAWTSYMKYGFPLDEVTPISCKAYGPSSNQKDIIRNDVLGNISSTLLDNLDTLILFGRYDDLGTALGYLESQKSTFFDQNVIVQVFETTIRALGGLMSAHLMLTESEIADPLFQEISNNYDGFLLEMAHDLGKRLIPAFETKTSIPLPRMNLRKGLKGVPRKYQKETCTSGVTTPVLEMTLLSRLTGDPQFEQASQRSYWTLWDKRLDLNLLPMSIDPNTGEWNDAISGIGALIDSFYEYSLKALILFDDQRMLDVFSASYQALMTHLVKRGTGKYPWLVFANVGSENGLDATIWIDSLGGFWPGVQVLFGRIADAIGTHKVYLKLFDYFQAIPERWNCLTPEDRLQSQQDVIGLEWYPLRPEFVESTYYLYRATRDSIYLQIGLKMVDLFEKRFKAPCGFHGIQDVRTGEWQDRMELFVLGETLKYLYLLFDEANEVFLHKQAGNWVFSTEAHPLWVPRWAQIMARDGAEDAVQSNYSTSAAVCELAPPRRPFQSLIYTATPFEFDEAYAKYLYRPPYLLQSHVDGLYVELDPQFYRQYTMGLREEELWSPAPHSTTTMEVFIGERKDIRQHVPRRNGTAVYVDLLNAVRVGLEFLAPGEVDTRHQHVEHRAVAEANYAVAKNTLQSSLINTLIRILQVNGEVLGPDDLLMVPKFGSDGTEVIGDRLVMNGMVVENIRVF